MGKINGTWGTNIDNVIWKFHLEALTFSSQDKEGYQEEL